MKRALLFTVVLALVLSASGAWAQITAGQINGTVTDPTGAVVANAQVTARNPDTGLVRTAKTGPSGNYVVAQLPPGRYEVRIEAPGFATVVQKDVGILVGQFVTLNFQVKPGATSEVVQVTGEAPLVNLTQSAITGNVTPLEVQDLPVRDRNFASLMQLIPGVRPAPNFDPTKSRSGTVSAGGSDGRAWDYNVDGGDNKDNVIGGIVQNFTLEGIQEFNVETNRYTAESGRSVGGVVNVVTKSGTNTLHGSLFGEFQNSVFNAKSAFDRTAGPDGKAFTADDKELPKPNYKRYHFGGSIGGPIVKDKLFFFGAYEYKRELAAINPDPTAVANELLIPQFAQPATSVKQPFFDHLLTAKIDYNISKRQTMFLRYGRERWITLNDQPTSAGPPISDLTEATQNVNQFHSLVAQHNFTISPTKLNVFSFQVRDFVNAITATPGRTFTYPIAGGAVATNPTLIFPSAEIGNNTNVPQETLIRAWQFRDDFSWTAGKHSLKFGGNWIYLSRLGGFFFSTPGYNVFFNKDLTEICTSAATCGGPTGQLALAGSAVIDDLVFTSGNPGTNNVLNPHSLGLYFQDNWKVTPHLTLNLGLRWDANIHMLNPQLASDFFHSNRAIEILRSTIAANPNAPGAQEGLATARFLAGDTSELRRTTADWKEFQPRIGFVWDPTGSGKVAIRGGYGIARDQIFQNLTLWSIQQSNPTVYQSISFLPLGAFQFGATPFPAPPPAPTDLLVGATGRINGPNITDPWSQQMSIGAQIQLHPDYALTVDYVHTLGTHEPRMLDFNPRIGSVCNPTYGGNTADPRCVGNGAGTGPEDTRLLDAAFQAAGIGAGRLGQLRTVMTNNRSLYDGINFVVRKRMTHRVMFQGSYVLSWSRSWGGVPIASYGGSFLTMDPRFQFRPENFGYTDFDERHRFVFSGVFDLPHGFEVAPIFQASSARPIDPFAGSDIDGDGRVYMDRVCSFNAADPTASVTTPGCKMLKPNSLRGFPFVQMDLSLAKRFKLSERASARAFWEFHNLFNRFNKCNAVQNDTSSGTFGQPLQGPISGPYCSVEGGVFGTGGSTFGPGFSTPFRSQFGVRFEF